MKNENWEREFDEKFPWLSSQIKVTPNKGEDYEKARILQELVNKTNEDIKKFINLLLAKQQEEVIADYQTNYEQKHIASAIEVAREEFVKCIPEENNVIIEGAGYDSFANNYMIKGYNKCIADIKSKLK
jgi:hypothetical protein